MSVIVEQINSKGNLINDYDFSENSARKFYERVAGITGSEVIKDGSKNLLKYRKNIVALKQITYLGNPHPHYKKRAQMPSWFPDIYDKYTKEGYNVFFMGVYTYGDNVIMFNFKLDTYSGNKFNNSSAHIMINDIYQATKKGYYKKIDKNKNIIECFKPDMFQNILGNIGYIDPELTVIDSFNNTFEFNEEINVMKCVPEMVDNNWPDKYQGEWPGFYLEYRYDEYLNRTDNTSIMQFQKVKDAESYDFDIYFPQAQFYGDLKSSTNEKNVSPGNDKDSLDKYLEGGNKFWYLIYEHDTKLAKNNDDKATIAWNEYRLKTGYKKLQTDVKNGKIDWMLSYKNRLKESVTYTGMFVLEINEVNKHLIFKDFNQGHQPDGSKRKGKYMIKKKDIDNFIVYRY